MLEQLNRNALRIAREVAANVDEGEVATATEVEISPMMPGNIPSTLSINYYKIFFRYVNVFFVFETYKLSI